MGPIQDQIEQLLTEGLAPSSLEVINNSASHAAHFGGGAIEESHFTIRITAPSFAGKPRIAQHRMVYALLDPLIKAGLHAIKLETKAK